MFVKTTFHLHSAFISSTIKATENCQKQYLLFIEDQYQNLITLLPISHHPTIGTAIRTLAETTHNANSPLAIFRATKLSENVENVENVRNLGYLRFASFDLIAGFCQYDTPICRLRSDTRRTIRSKRASEDRNVRKTGDQGVKMKSSLPRRLVSW